MKVGTKVARDLVETAKRHGIQISGDFCLGGSFRLTELTPSYTREEENGFHWLLDQWLKMDRRLTVSADDLKTMVLTAWSGAARHVGPGGQEVLKPLRRTTKRYNPDTHRYESKKLTREQYADLIDFAYRMAAEDGIDLPELDPEHRHAQ